MEVWRLVKTRYAATAFDGEGARLYGARWNSVGTRVAYASDHAALAVLEVLVHLDDASILPAYSLVTASLPDDAVQELDPARLTDGWGAYPATPITRAIGDAWVRSGEGLALKVPSVIAPGGSNLLINPEHRDAHLLEVGSIQPFSFDPRLVR